MRKSTTILAIFLILASCRQRHRISKNSVTKNGNIQTTISTDTTALSRLVNIKDFKPTYSKFRYVFIDNSGQNGRITVPGPSDSYLQAVLYFDTITFNRLITTYHTIDYPSPRYDLQTFNFEWLDTNLRDELLKSDTNYHGHPDYFFGLGHSGKLWFLHNKVLLVKGEN